MRIHFLGCLLGLFCCIQAVPAQDVYREDANAMADIDSCIQVAKQSNRHVLIQAGGNWCAPCLAFVLLCKQDPKIDSLIKSSFVWYHLNWTEDNANKAAFARLGYPHRFGFPVFVILDGNGQRLHTQNSLYLENAQRQFDRNRVLDFLEMWTPRVLAPDIYGD